MIGLTNSLASEEALSQAKAGNKSAFESIVSEFAPVVFGIALHFHANQAVAEDLSQEIFLDLYRHLKKIESGTHLLFWLRRTTTNRCIDHCRKAARRGEVPLEGLSEPGWLPELHDGLQSECVRKQVAKLPEWQRAVVILRYQEELEMDEIAGILDIPLNTAKSRLHRALQTLRERLSRTQRAQL
jgi:RNA polymerase sigma-70 factor, ECF subfamily